VISNPIKRGRSPEAKVKTDKVDAAILAQLLAIQRVGQIVKLCLAGVGSARPRESIARTWNVWLPCAKPV
jgi:hypothetical protein